MKESNVTASALPLLTLDGQVTIEKPSEAESPSKEVASSFALERETVSRVPMCKVYYHRISRRFWLWDEKRGRVFEMTRTQVKDRLMQSGLSKGIAEGRTTSAVTDAVIRIERTMWVDEVDFADPSPHCRHTEEDGNVVLCVGEYHAQEEGGRHE